MAVAGLGIGANSVSSGSNLLFTKFEKAIARTLNDEAKAFKMCAVDEDWSGDFIEGRVHTQRNTAFGFTEDGGGFSTPSQQRYATYKIGRRFFQAKLQLTDGIMAAARNSPQVAKEAVASEVDGMLKDTMKFYNLMFFRDGTGSVATVSAPLPTAAETHALVDDSRLCWDGATLELYTGTTYRSDLVVSSTPQAFTSGKPRVNFTSITGSSGANVAAGDVLYWKGSYGRVFTGLDTLIDDGGTTFQNVAMATYPRYSSFVLSNSGLRQLTPSLLRTLLAGVKTKAGGDVAGGLTLFGDNWMGVEFEEMYESELRITPSDSKVGVAGTTFGSAFGNLTLVSDVDCKRNTIFAVDKSQLHHKVQKTLGFRLDGGQMFKRNDDAGVWTATMVGISQMYIHDRITSGKIENVQDQNSIAY